MKRFGEATIVHFGSAHLTGYSLMQLIETSSITGHFVDQNGDAYIDIFSCKPFCEEKAKAVVQKYFNPQNIKSLYFTRQARNSDET
jgi:S-adenosylmethionine/arginine decarboxylase-like enzyme